VGWKLPTIARRIVVILLIFPALIGCGRAKEELAAENSSDVGSSAPAEALLGEDENRPSSLSNRRTTSATESPVPSGRSAVIIGGDPGLTVTGEGTSDPTRSRGELERQLRRFLPQLREVYDLYLMLDPHGMGSLDVKMTIEPSGKVSELRFPLKRVSSEKLTSAVYDVMRTWHFTPAEHTVDLRYRVILVPAGIDPASIGRWEQQLADRMEVERSGEMTSPALSAAITSREKFPTGPGVIGPKEPDERTVPERQRGSVRNHTAEEEKQEDERLQPRASQQETENPRRFLAQWYQVTRPTALYETPHSSAAVVTRLQAGKHIWVVDIVEGQWLEVRSVKGKRSGFLPREDAKPEQRKRARR
jgi:hypothetical protein